MMDNTLSNDDKILPPPTMPQLNLNAASLTDQDRRVLTIFADIINTQKILYRNLLRLLYSCDLIEQVEYTEIPDAQGNLIKIPTPKKTEIVKVPSASKYCAVCFESHEKMQKQHSEPKIYPEKKIFCPNCKSLLTYYDWRPLVKAQGFNYIISTVMADSDEIMSTGYIKEDSFRGKKYPQIEKLAVSSAISILESITENAADWSPTSNPNLSKGQYKSLGLLLAKHYYFTMSRSIEAKMINSMGASTELKIINSPTSEDRNVGAATKPKSWKDIFFGMGSNGN